MEEIRVEGRTGVKFGHTRDEVSVRHPFGDAEYGK